MQCPFIANAVSSHRYACSACRYSDSCLPLSIYLSIYLYLSLYLSISLAPSFSLSLLRGGSVLGGAVLSTLASTTLNPFAVTNRQNLFVYQEKSGSVYVLRTSVRSVSAAPDEQDRAPACLAQPLPVQASPQPVPHLPMSLSSSPRTATAHMWQAAQRVTAR